jgi:hypothetical protein
MRIGITLTPGLKTTVNLERVFKIITGYVDLLNKGFSYDRSLPGLLVGIFIGNIL